MLTALPPAPPAQNAAELPRLRDALVGEKHWLMLVMECDFPALQYIARSAALPAGCGAFAGAAAWFDPDGRKADYAFLAIPKSLLGRRRLDALLAGVGCGPIPGGGDVMLLGDAAGVLPPLLTALRDGEVRPHDPAA